MIGRTIAGYTINEQLGAGGMGVVYKAEDTGLRRSVAIKFLHPELMKEEDAKVRFLQEARVAASLDHQNICAVHSIEEEGDQTFIVMAYIEGQDLRTKLKQGPLPMEETLNLFSQIGAGLQAAHRKGVIHRDIKPENIMISTDGVVKITDFGLAKLQGGDGPTRSHTALGTLAYMAPEQWRGEPLDHRADIFSQGVVLYEMIAGRLPFQGAYEAAMIYSILHQDPPALSTYRHDVPPDLQQVVDRSLSKSRDTRYSDIDALLSDINAVREDRPITPQPLPEPLPQPEPSPPPQPMISLRNALAAVLVVCVALLAWVLWPDYKEEPVKLAVMPFTGVSSDSGAVDFTDGFTEDLMIGLSPVRALRISSRNAVIEYKDKTIQPQVIGRELGVAYLLSGRIRQDAGLVQVTAWVTSIETGFQVWMDRWSTPIDGLLSTKAAIVRKVVDELDISLTQEESAQVERPVTPNPEAYEHYLQGLGFLWKRTRADNELSAGFFQRAISLDSTFTAAYARLAHCYSQRIDLGWIKTLNEYNTVREEIFNLAQRAIELDRRSSIAHLMLAGYYFRERNMEQMSNELMRVISLNPSSATAYRSLYIFYLENREYNQALDAARNLTGLEPNQSPGYKLQGDIYGILGQSEPAIQSYRRAIEINPGQISYQLNLAEVYCEAGRYGDAEQVYQKIIHLNPDTFISYKKMGDYYTVWLRDYDNAVKWYQQALERSPDRFVPLIYKDLGDLYMHANQPDSMISYYRRAPPASIPIWLIASHRGTVDMDMVIRWAQQILATRPNDHTVRYALGLAYERQENRQQALAWYDSSVAHLQPQTGENVRDDTPFYFLALSLAKLGRIQEAIPPLERASLMTHKLSGVAIYQTALVYAFAGEDQKAHDQLERAFKSHPYLIDWAAIDWEMERLRKKTSIQELLEQYR